MFILPGFIELPDPTTLRKYSNFAEPTSGFDPDIIDRFLLDVKDDEMEDKDKNCAVLFDEMKIKSGLVFNRHTGKIVGFTSIGDINEELRTFEKTMSSNEGQDMNRDIATYITCVMIRGLFTKYEFPIAYFPSQGMTSDQLFPSIWEAVDVIESVGFKVRCFVSDGASPNRRFYKLHKLDGAENQSVEGNVFWAWNRFDLSRKIYFICDVPHLMKTTRNNLENSHWNKMTRSLTVRIFFFREI